MAKINAKTTSGGGIETVGDASGVLELQSDGTTVINATTVSGNPRITGDFSNATAASRLAIQTSTTNGVSDIPVIPNGTATTARHFYYNTSDIANASTVVAVGATSTEGTFRVSGIGLSPVSLPMTFYTGGSERMRIDTSGNLFIGTTTNPVSNAVGIINAVVSSGDGFNLKHTVNGNNMFNLWQTGTTTYVALSFSKGDTQTIRGSISVSTSSVSYNTGSDYRLKENIEPMVGALNTVSQLKPVTYTWKESGSDGQGFIAHELAEVVPDCVTGEKDAVDAEGNPQYQGVDTSFLVATLTAAIQEQQAIITDLKARIEVLENSNGID
jgi:hypothetical protein